MSVLKKLGLSIKDNFLTKTYGFYVGLASFIIMILIACIYCGIGSTLYNSNVMLYVILGICLFVVFSIFKETALLSQVSVVVFSFLSFCAFANTDGLIDYVSTQFFDGFTLAKSDKKIQSESFTGGMDDELVGDCCFHSGDNRNGGLFHFGRAGRH